MGDDAARTLVLHVADTTLSANNTRDASAALGEAVGLAEAIALDIVHAEIIRLRKKTPSTLIGKGTIARLAEEIANQAIALAIIDTALSPLQQRNLEKGLGCKVIDRTALILEIFGARARTAEGKLQVELAALTYQKSRLVRSWTHLERQRGGVGFMGGPGESQIEIDRRLIAERIVKIKNQLIKVMKTRHLHRQKRSDVPYPVVALVGYTNAGKSTLFNRLTGSDVMAKDMLFATLDPTIRALDLPSGARIMLSDTVGFISNLPTELVAAFRATLEEVLLADIIVHVRDMADPDSAMHHRDVMAVLKKLFDGDAFEARMVELHNKMDLVPEGEAPLSDEHTLDAGALRCSAVTGEGLAALLEVLDTRLINHAARMVHVHLPIHAGKARAWLFRNGEVLSDHVQEDGTQQVHARLRPADYDKFFQLHGQDLLADLLN